MTAFVIPKKGFAPEPVHLRRSLSVTLPDFMIPQRFVVLDEIPLTNNGKLDRSALHRIAAEGKSSKDILQQQHETPRGPTPEDGTAFLVELVCHACERLLNLSTVSAEDNFIEIGGDSISAVHLALEIRELGTSVSSRDILQAESLSELARNALIPDHSDSAWVD